MKTIFEFAPQIIHEAAGSVLGILALLCLAISIIAYLFFRKSSENIRAAIFILLFLGVIGFGVSVFLTPARFANGNGLAIEPQNTTHNGGIDSVESVNNRWYVVVASAETVQNAAAQVKLAKDKGFPNAIYILQPQSKYIAVVAGENLSRTEAEALSLQVQKAGVAKSPFLWPYPMR